MKKTATLFVALFFVFANIFAQKTNDNGSTGGNAKDNNKPQNNENTNGDTSSDGLLIQITKIVFGAYQNALISKKGNDKSVFGMEAGMAVGYLGGTSGNFITLDPRIKYNKGALSFDVRYDYLKGDYTSQNADILAEFNIIVGKVLKAAIGQGIMYNIDNNLIYHESLLGIDLGLNNKQIIISPEFRMAYDWSVHRSVNTEINLKGAYRILKLNAASLYLFAGGGYRGMSGFTYGNVFGGLNLLF
jgi:hypothetical protein